MLALVGVAVVLIQETIAAFPWQPRQEAGLLVLAIAVPLVLVTLSWGMPDAWLQLRRHPDLLVPLGILTLAEAVVGWLTLVPALGALLAPSKQLQFAALSFTVSVSFLIVIALNVAYGAWVTVMILNVARADQADLVTSWSSCLRWFLRVLGLEFIGWAVLFAGLAVGLMLAPISMVLALPVIGIGALVWNLATAALLPVVLDARLSFWQALGTGIRVSWANKGRWWKPVLMQMALLGWLTLVVVSYSESTARGYSSHNNTNWAVNAFWTGGYENGCRWYTDLMKALNAPKVTVIATLLGLVFGVLAIGVKLTIASQLAPQARQEGIEESVERQEPGEEEHYRAEEEW
ncbi:hypothetical protein AYO44_03645 [Planctomycetaceae bacterium SCGC AG-212-F19]|nr:hypothetical protein AYO44_03645 [Planctomycetaceae bacterium SCGC AG-212-F19]